MFRFKYPLYKWQPTYIANDGNTENAGESSWQREGVEWTARYPKHPLCYCVTDVTNVTDVT